MDKPSDAFRTIGEMAKELGVKTHILRYWEEQFPMLRPLKRAGGRRHYRADDVALLHNINRLLNQQGYTIKGAIKSLSGEAVPAQMASANAAPAASATTSPANAAPAASATTSPKFFGELRAIRDRLSAALEAA